MDAMLYPESSTAAVSRQIRPVTAESQRLRHGPPIPRPPPCRLASAAPRRHAFRQVPALLSVEQRTSTSTRASLDRSHAR